MLSEDFSLKFVGFAPSEDMVNKIKIALSDLYACSPHRSFLRATFSSTGQAFEGIIDITSAAGKFVVEVKEHDIETLSKAAFEKIRWKLDAWKAKRFI